MKKISLLGLGLFTAMAATAQTNVVNDAKHMLDQAKPDYAAVQKTIQPALQDPSTANTAMPWYINGKAGFGIFDNAYMQEALGTQLSAAQKKAAGAGLLEGYNSYIKALPLDVEIDKKTGEPKLDKKTGKAKPGKLVKEMVKTMKDNYISLKTGGIYLFDVQDYSGAYDVWEMYVNLPSSSVLGDDAPKAEADTLVGQIMYYQLLAALSSDRNAEALAKVPQIEKTGYKNIDVYVYGIEAARRLNDSIAQLDLAKRGYAQYGTQNVSFVGQLINEHLQHNDFDGCYKLVNEAIAATPDSMAAVKSQLYDILGVIYEQQDKSEAAIEAFDKAISIDATQGKNYYDKARVIYNQAVKIDESMVDAPESERKAKVDPLLLDAAKLFEKAYEIDSTNLTNIPSILYRLYYRLGAGYEEQAETWKDR